MQLLALRYIKGRSKADQLTQVSLCMHSERSERIPASFALLLSRERERGGGAREREEEREKESSSSSSSSSSSGTKAKAAAQ
jgi:hypothetical protein